MSDGKMSLIDKIEVGFAVCIHIMLLVGGALLIVSQFL